MIFVFGSNLSGIHGAGAAKVAMKLFGAQYGVGKGHVGNSYAIPTKNRQIATLPISDIKTYIDEFIEYAKNNPDKEFKVTQIGCGLAGYHPREIAPLFEAAPNNCLFDHAWQSYLPGKRTWGSY